MAHPSGEFSLAILRYLRLMPNRSDLHFNRGNSSNPSGAALLSGNINQQFTRQTPGMSVNLLLT
jgi:hypothetical protein